MSSHPAGSGISSAICLFHTYPCERKAIYTMTEMITLNHVECLERVIAPGKIVNAVRNVIRIILHPIWEMLSSI